MNDPRAPALSVGLPVRNEVDVLPRCIESILSQDFTDLELVVSDNMSDDGTLDLLDRYARTDPRVRVHRNEVNIGQNANLNRVFELSRGTLFRWISADDWLEPGCLSSCVEALRANEEAIGVTTWFTIHMPDGASRYEEYRGEYPTSPDAARRLERMLWFFHAGDAAYDPIYGMYRREALRRSSLLLPSEQSDWLLASELALQGPIVHVPKRLANRSRSYGPFDPVAYRQRLNPAYGERLRSSARRFHRDVRDLVAVADLTQEQRRRCMRSLRRFSARDVVGRARGHLSARLRRLTPRRRDGG